MFNIDSNNVISITRGDVASISITVNNNGEEHTFIPGDIVRFKVFKKNDCNSVFILKDIEITEEGTICNIPLEKSDTKIGDMINKPVDYWYEIELNPETHPQTIIGYDANGPKIFRLYPEGGDSI
jgi:hypothetical protein